MARLLKVASSWALMGLGVSISLITTTAMFVSDGMRPTYVLDVQPTCQAPQPQRNFGETCSQGLYHATQFCFQGSQLSGNYSTACHRLCPGESPDRGRLAVYRPEGAETRCAKTCPSTTRRCRDNTVSMCGECVPIPRVVTEHE